MADFKINGKNVITQSGTAEPVLASNVELARGIVKGGMIQDAATSTLSCTTNSSTTVTTADTSSLSLGMMVSGTNIPAGASIVTIPNSTSFTIPSAATGGATSTLTFQKGIGSIKIEDNAVTGAKIEDNPTIAGNLTVSGTSALTGNATAAGTLGVTGATTLAGGTTLTGGLEQQTATQNLTGTYSTQKMFLNDSYSLTGDVTVTGHLTLGTIADADVIITDDGTARQITGSGILEAGDLVHQYRPTLTGMTGEINSAVTGSPAINLSNAEPASGSVVQVVFGRTQRMIEVSQSSSYSMLVEAEITPRYSTSRILIDANVIMGHRDDYPLSHAWVVFRFERGSTIIDTEMYGGSDYDNLNTYQYWGYNHSIIDIPGSTSTHLYKYMFHPNYAGTWRAQRGCNIKLMEIKA